MNPKPAISLHDVSLHFDQRRVLDGVTADIPSAAWTAVIGPNGAGKSSLLRVMAGLLSPVGHGSGHPKRSSDGSQLLGDVSIQGRLVSEWPAPELARHRAWLGQQEPGSEDLRGLDVALLGRLPHQRWWQGPTAGDVQAAEQALRDSGTWALRERRLGELSGGERQRLMLARAWSVQAPLLLMDEPLAHLDPPHQADWLAQVRRHCAQGHAVVSVLHELNMALSADWLLLLREGRLVHAGAPTDEATRLALEAVFDQRVVVHAVGSRWVALPDTPAAQEALALPEPAQPQESGPWPSVQPLHEPQLEERLQHLLNQKTKPLGSLGRIEALAWQIGRVLGTEAPVLERPQLLVCAGDHGLAARGVSAYPSDVTWQMVENFLSGGAAVSVLARQHGLALSVVDCGVRHEFAAREAASGAPQLLLRKVAWGTADASEGPAMSAEQCAEAMANGAALVKDLPGNVVLLGEMGIGNTSAAALLMSRLTGEPIGRCTGAGTGLDAAGVAHKRAVLQQVLHRHAHVQSPVDVLAAMGGLEIATLAGVALQSASERRVVLVDGFIASAAVLVAARLQPAVLERCVFAHVSDEAGHALLLRHLGAQPLLKLGLRLGEASGAALAWPLLVSACALLREMASFESAGVDSAKL